MNSSTVRHQSVSSVLPSRPLKTYFGKSVCPPRGGDEEIVENGEEFLPLPDIVLCSALSANILHGRRIRERRRHKATVQTKGKEHLNLQDAEDLMEPLIPSMEALAIDEVSMNPNPNPKEDENEEEVDCVYHTKRRRTISSSSTARKLTTLSNVALATGKLKKDAMTIDDTPEGVFNGLKNLFKNVFAN